MTKIVKIVVRMRQDHNFTIATKELYEIMITPWQSMSGCYCCPLIFIDDTSSILIYTCFQNDATKLIALVKVSSQFYRKVYWNNFVIH